MFTLVLALLQIQYEQLFCATISYNYLYYFTILHVQYNNVHYYSLLQENPKPTKQTVEDNFDGHICRCTGKKNTQITLSINLPLIGYRSILDAAKSFAVDSDEPEIIDIEVNISVYLNTQ